MGKFFKLEYQKLRCLSSSSEICVNLDDHQMQALICIMKKDLSIEEGELSSGCEACPLKDLDYYSIPIDRVRCPLKMVEPLREIERLFDLDDDTLVFLRCLSDLHKRRVKYSAILHAQSIPDIVTVLPRSLLEYGTMSPDRLAAWIVVRKWLYDIDNRSAQETGYLFEPILANAIGGVPVPAKKSPIKRSSNKGVGRQIDCLLDRKAYELKMRVTIAASGQGRFGEELDFAKDCSQSGYTPILVVLDPTPSKKLTELADEYSRYGGTAYIGEDAWDHIEGEAGTIMSTFIKKYVRTILEEVGSSLPSEIGVTIELTERSLRVIVNGEAVLEKQFPESGGAPCEQETT